MPKTLNATDARTHFSRLLQRVKEEGEIFIVELGGKPQAVVLPLGEYERLRELATGGEGWEHLLDETIEMVDHDLKGRRLPAPDEIIRQMRAERDVELLDLH